MMIRRWIRRRLWGGGRCSRLGEVREYVEEVWEERDERITF